MGYSPGHERRKRVAFLFGHLHAGGMQKAVSNISRALPDGIEQFILYFGTENPGFDYRGEMVDLNVPGDLRSGPAAKVGNFVRRIRRLRDFVHCRGIDTVVSFGETASVVNVLTGGKRTVLSVRISLDELLSEEKFYGPIYKRLVRLSYRRGDAIVAVSEGIADQLASEYGVPPGKITIIPNLFDLARIRIMAKEEIDGPIGTVLDHPTIINVGNLCAQKGQDHLIRCFAAAKRRIPDLQLLLIGRGDRKAYLAETARSMEVDDSVHFLGFQPNPYKYLAKANLFVLTSRYEGFPNVLVEAMICGVPVMATDCRTGPREILGDSEFGVLLPDIARRDVQEVERIAAKWMERLLLEPELSRHYRQKALARCYDFRQELLIGKWLEIL
jgi:glycosyltransferase involved in cell wall biosynthesis